MRILVTGGTGFVGARLVESLAADHEVFVLGRRKPAGLNPEIRWLMQDLAAPHWTVFLPDQVDAVVHLAQSPNFRDFPDRASDIYAVAAGTTMRLLDWSLRAGAKTFVLGSTGGLYGASVEPVTESSPVPEQRSQLGFYFASKRAAELLAQQYAGQLNVVTLRFFFIYGAGQAQQMLLPRLAANVREGKSIFLHGQDGIRLNPIHVSDVVQSISRCLDLKESRLFNVAGPEVTTLRHVAETIGRLLGREPVLSVDNITQPNHLVANIDRMSRTLKTPLIDVEAGIGELLGLKTIK